MKVTVQTSGYVLFNRVSLAWKGPGWYGNYLKGHTIHVAFVGHNRNIMPDLSEEWEEIRWYVTPAEILREWLGREM